MTCEKIVLTDAEKHLDIRAIVEEIERDKIQTPYHATVRMIGRVALALSEGVVEACRLRDVYRKRLAGAEFARGQYLTERDRARKDAEYWKKAHAEACKELADVRDERNKLRIEVAELRKELEQECVWPTEPFEQALYDLGDYHDEQAPNGPEDDPFREIAQADSYQLPPATIPLLRLERNLSHARPNLHTSDLRAIAHDAVLAYSYALSQDAKEDNPGDVDEGEDTDQEATPEAAY